MMAAWNPGFERMAALPAEFWSGDKRYDRYIRLLADRGELGDGDPADIVQSHLDASRQQMPYPRLYRPYPLAAALGHLGRGDEARFALKAAVAASPSFFDLITRSRLPYNARMLDGLGKEGWRG
jgi:hypothetical protein